MYNSRLGKRGQRSWRRYGAQSLAVACLLGWAAFAHSQTNYQRLNSFGATQTDGTLPLGRLLEGHDGWLYGTTYAGGNANQGTVFKLHKDGSAYTVLWNLTNASPQGGLVEVSPGLLYGTTTVGGTSNQGTVFELNPNGTGFAVVHDFGSSATNGSSPSGTLLLGPDGALYGTTIQGGVSNLGTVYRLTTNGDSFTILHSFTGATNNDGANPNTSLKLGMDDMLYGTTQNGGSNNFGTVFKVSTSGGNYTVLHRFAGSGAGDGRESHAALALDTSGVLYGVTRYGGTNDLGTIFKVSTNGTGYSVLHSFTLADIGGYQPWAGLVLATNGVLYGTTRYGNTNSNDAGTVFRINTDGSGYTLLHQFTGTGGDGAYPQAGLAIGSDNSLYGVTSSGGNANVGTVFRLFSSAPQIIITHISKTSTNALLNLSGGASGQTYNIQATTNLAPVNGWQVIGSSPAGIDGKFTFLDTGVSNYPTRFYRSAVP